MKKIITALLTAALLIASSAYAWLLGANSYEECINDGKVGRTTAEMSALSTKCYNQFPKLQKLSINKDVSLVCRDINEKSIYKIEVKGDKIKFDQLPNRKFTKTSYDKTSMTFVGDGKDKETNQLVKIYGNISILYGSGNIKVEYIDATKNDYDYYFTCYES